VLGYRGTPNTFLKENKNQAYLSEAYGKGDKMPEFTIISPDGTQIGSWMRCKDFIQDTIWGFKNNKSYSIYGWKFNPKSDAVSKRYLFLGMRWRASKKLKENLENVKATIEDVEKRVGIPLYQRTRFSRVLSNKGAEYFVVYGSPAWTRCIGTVSFFTWLLRASLTNSGRTLETIEKANTPVANDKYYLRGGEKFIKKLFSHGIESFKPDWSISSVNEAHHNGFVQYSRRIKTKKKKKKVKKAISAKAKGKLSKKAGAEDDSFFNNKN
jgi:hypothetical protein